MNFSDYIAQTSGIVKYSPNGDLVAVAKTFEVKVRPDKVNGNSDRFTRQTL
jgi:hypothetical protein